MWIGNIQTHPSILHSLSFSMEQLHFSLFKVQPNVFGEHVSSTSWKARQVKIQNWLPHQKN